MGKLQSKGRQLTSAVAKLLLITLVIMQIFHVAADKQTSRHDTKYNRRRRQAADMVLMNYNVQKAIKGTTRPSDYFQRIGKKWAPSSGTNNQGANGLNGASIWLHRGNVGSGLYLEPDEYVENW